MAPSCILSLLFLCSLVLLLCSHTQGLGKECPPTITQEATGYKIFGKPQWLVTIYLGCACDLYKLKLLCPNFASVDPRTNPAIIHMYEKDHCLIHQGNTLYGNEAYRFTYTWDKVNFEVKWYLVANCTWY